MPYKTAFNLTLVTLVMVGVIVWTIFAGIKWSTATKVKEENSESVHKSLQQEVEQLKSQYDNLSRRVLVDEEVDEDRFNSLERSSKVETWQKNRDSEIRKRLKELEVFRLKQENKPK